MKKGIIILAVMKGDCSYSWAGAAGVAHQESGEPMTEETPIYTASVLKLYTATIIMRLYEMGYLSLDDPMSKYLPEELIKGIHVYQGKDYSGEITIKQLLSHTSGIADYYMEKPEGGKSVFETLLDEPERQWKDNETIEWARDKLKPNFPPGKGASYSDTNFDLLQKIIESITGKGTLQLMHDWHKIFSPMEYGYGTMHFKLPGAMIKASGLTPLWGHSGSTGSFLYYSEDLDLYMAGTIDRVGADFKPFMLMHDVMKLFREKCKS